MNKTSRKVLSVILAVMLLCSIMSISVFASEDDPIVIVYFTRGNFTTGGWDFNSGNYIPSIYQGATPIPAATTKFANDMFAVPVHLNQVNTATTKTYYNPDFTGNKNVLDVIITAILACGRTPDAGWSGYYNAGYLNGFLNDGGVINYDGVLVDGDDGLPYYYYAGTQWQFAYNTSSGGTLVASSTYATNITTLFDGMAIVFDLSPYTMYYPAY